MTKTTVESASDEDDDVLSTESFFMTCKLVDLTLDDMEYMTIGECLDYVDHYLTIKRGDTPEKIRSANQSDFDAF